MNRSSLFRNAFALAAASALSFAISIIACTPKANAGDTANFRFAPVGLLIGNATIGFDFAIDSNWTLGPELEYSRLSMGTSTENISEKSYAAGLRANWFSNGLFKDGLYLGPAVHYRDLDVSFTQSDGTTLSSHVTGPSISLLIGYGWFWDSFNIMLGGGLETQLGKSSVTFTRTDGTTYENDDARVSFAGEFSLGWTF